MWTPKPNGTALALNSPASPTAQFGPEGDSGGKKKKKGVGGEKNQLRPLKHFAWLSWFLLPANTNNQERCKEL